MFSKKMYAVSFNNGQTIFIKKMTDKDGYIVKDHNGKLMFSGNYEQIQKRYRSVALEAIKDLI